MRRLRHSGPGAPHRACGLWLGVLLTSAVHGQMLMVDRPPEAGAPAVASGAGFTGDHFTLGNAGEVWIIDSIRVWASAMKVPNPYGKALLFGGIEAAPARPGEPE